ncbi:alanine racemase [Dolosicoccus paucivorans]|uniref:Alanine racemase n=1 Tax=Dolosicoccus paucivorans TaxID=84521 RepID=A0A2N6SMK8_9LACT|nr:alanine racemase [Dolosicoccus paucivorans]PMB84017.1 alanine racemase [Dolosicoccus paucivorans]PMC58279.1 alanine racemase [Dolosicoccus paucivorans]
MIRPSQHRPTQAIIDLAAIRYNICLMQEELTTDQKIYAVIKANAYGHGAVEVGKAAEKAGVDGLAVATVDEGIELRKAGMTKLPILILGLTDPRGIAEVIYYDLTLTVSDIDFFAIAYRQLEQTGQLSVLEDQQLTFHLALDTGMGRIGLQTIEELDVFKKDIQRYPWAHWEGAFTHFATAGGGEESYIDTQWDRWVDFLKHLPESVKERHYSNTAMGWWQKRPPFSTIVRYGISMYGIDPKDQLPPTRPLKPALSLMTEIVHVKRLKKGYSISYGATYTAEEDEWIATLPIGYGDGWHRHYQNLNVLINGQSCPVVGAINMDQMMVKIPKNWSVGTLVTLIGSNGHKVNEVSRLAKEAGTISYEMLATLGPRIERVYLDYEEKR